MKALVTGGAGFIGSNFLKYLISHHSGEFDGIRVLDKLTYSGTLANLSGITPESFYFIHGDICNQSVTRSAIAGIDVVFHFAAESHVDRSIAFSRVFLETNVLGTQTLLEEARMAKVKTFVHVSTDEVYGSVSDGSWTEMSPLAPNSPYAASKASSDLVALAFARTYKMDIRITRCSNNYGPNQFPEKVIPLFATNLFEGKKVPLYGDGRNSRDWLHVEDHCNGVFLAYKNGRPGEVYNLGGGRELTNLELTRLILEEFDVDEAMVERVADRPGHDLRYSLDDSKARRELGYQPKWKFEDGLKATLNWYRANQSWWQPLKYPPL